MQCTDWRAQYDCACRRLGSGSSRGIAVGGQVVQITLLQKRENVVGPASWLVEAKAAICISIPPGPPSTAGKVSADIQVRQASQADLLEMVLALRGEQFPVLPELPVEARRSGCQ